MHLRLPFLLSALLLAPFLRAANTPPHAAPNYGHDDAHGHTAPVNGIRLYYETYGAATGAPLVLLHGNGGSIAAMHFQIDFFRATRQVIAIDSRGHGRSEMGATPLTYEKIADDVAALLAQLHAAPADILGWSDGGIVALQLALRHPDRVRRIALSGANLVADALKPDDFAGMKTGLAEVRAKLAAGDRSPRNLQLEQHLVLMVDQTTITAEDLRRITCPALVLAGERDMIPEPHTRAIAAGLPHAQLHIFPGASHGALQEIPAEFNRVVAEFLAAP
ncbi:MAG: alpha/beta fold hydrolase [Candidatus Didemnitutus sp.]|nr:alpha/beta fold hydrolase [Candidatus Didemnitutus sp.]